MDVAKIDAVLRQVRKGYLRACREQRSDDVKYLSKRLDDLLDERLKATKIPAKA